MHCSMLQFIKFGSARWHLVVLTSLQAGPILYLGLAHGLQVRSDAVVSQPQIQLSNCNDDIIIMNYIDR